MRLAWPALLLAALLLGPFFHSAFTVDDTVFLAEARHALSDPLHPTAFEMTWLEKPERVSRIVPTGPVMAWLLMPCAAAGGAEWLAHAVQLLMLCLAVLATVSLALRLRLPRMWAGASGVLLVAMPAVPAMAVGVWGMERLVAWRDERRSPQGFLAALLLGLAPLARSHLLLLQAIALLFAIGCARGGARRRGFRPYLPVAAAPLVTVILYAVTSDPSPVSGTLMGTALHFSSVSLVRLASNAVAFHVHWVLAMAFALPWLALGWERVLRSPTVTVAGFGGALLAAAALAYVNRSSVPVALVAGIGFAALAEVVVFAWRRGEGDELGLALWLLVGLCAAPYVHLPSKYLVVSGPAAACFW